MLYHNFYHNKRILVTGGAGFIGSHLVEQLVHKGAYVTVIDNLSTGSLENLKNILSSLQFIHGNINDINVCKQAMYGQSMVIHLAALVSVPDSVKHPQATHDTNVTGTINLLEAARIAAIDRFLFSSSAAVYGDYASLCHENLPCKPLSPYGFSKLLAELYLQQYTEVYDLATLSMRFFNVISQQTTQPGVVAQWRKKFIAHEPIIVWGDGHQTRDFVPVNFLVETILKLATLPKASMKEHKVVNIASGKTVSLNQLFVQLQKEFPTYHLPLCYAPARPGDIMHSSADCTKLSSLLALV